MPTLITSPSAALFRDMNLVVQDKTSGSGEKCEEY